MTELADLLSPVGSFRFREAVENAQNGGNPEIAIYFDGMPRFLTEAEMRESDLLDVQADDEAAMEVLDFVSQDSHYFGCDYRRSMDGDF